jgi:D-glycero-D-manno-heptose 1,7-bisphosphate phosphatase
MNKAVFLDRDGVINRERPEGYTCRLEDFEILPDVVEVLKELQNKSYMLIVVTNQSGVGKGLYTEEDVKRLHAHLGSFLASHGVRFEEVYYCIHHPDTSNCICRKPGSLFIEKALARFGIDPSRSLFIGDKKHTDMVAAAAAGVKGILIQSNSSLKQILPYIG